MSAQGSLPDRPLSTRVRVGYGLGSFATGTFNTVPGLLLLYYLTDVIGVAAGLAGFLVFLPKAWDVLLNPWIGSRSDRTVHRWGPRRPWMLAGAIALPLGFAAMFAGPPLDRGWATAYVTVLFLVTATGMACFQVPFVALPAELTADHDERSRLMTWRVAFLAGAILLSGSLAPVLAGGHGDEDGTLSGYRLMGVVIAALVCAGGLASFLATSGAPDALPATTSEPSLAAQLRAARDNRPFMWLLAVYVVQAAAAGLMLAGAQYFATYILDDPDTVTFLFACLIVPSLLAMPLWLAIGRRLGKRNATFAASLCFLAGAAVVALCRQLPPETAYGAVALAGVGYAGMQMLELSMLGDAIAADTFLSGRRRAGMFTGLWTAGETMGLALGPALFGLVLTIGDFASSDADHRVPQPDSALTAVVVGFGALPVLLMLLSLPLLARYRLTEAELAELAEGARESGSPANRSEAAVQEAR